MNPKLAHFATSPLATLVQLAVTAIAIPLIGFVGARTIDELVSLNRAVARIELTNATIDQRTRALETLAMAHAEAITTLREKTLRHDYLIERITTTPVTQEPKK